MDDLPVRVLLVAEDEADYCLIQQWLSQIGRNYYLEQVTTVDSALESIAGQQHHVYLIDCDLSQPDRLELLRESVLNGYAAPVVLLVDSHQAAEIADGYAHFTDYLIKDEINPSLLERMIHCAMQQYQLRNDLRRATQEKRQLTRALEMLRKNEERYALVIQGSDDGIWDWNLQTQEIYFSPRWKSLLGYEETELTNHSDSWFDCIHPEERDRVKQEISAHLAGTSPRFVSVHRLRHRNGTYSWVFSRGIAVRDVTGEAVRFVGSLTDITPWKQTPGCRIAGITHDRLTGLPNRDWFTSRLHQAAALSRQDPAQGFAVLFVDLDRFKTINDSLGHWLGDRLLMEIAQRMLMCLRPCDTIARLGGDEFVILLEEVKTQEDVICVTQRIQQELSTPFYIEGHEVFVSASIGIVLSNTHYAHPEDLLRYADVAMGQAKKSQCHGGYEVFQQGIHADGVTQLQLKTDLRRAIDRQELQLHYQPIICLRTRRLIGFEALVRWQHPRYGLIAPSVFVPLAEETGLIDALGQWVLREACRQMRQWQLTIPQGPSLTINVNLSGKQFTPYLTQQIHQILKDTHLEARYLKLELTESILMSNADSAVATLRQLKQLGVQLAIDDFGTGYSSLSYLHRFPIDTLKIDRSFIHRVDVDGEQLAIVRTIMTLAWNLGMDVVAEGVETSKQLAQLRSLQCEYGQGFLFSKPVDPDSVLSLITTPVDDWQPRSLMF
ncbi:MAG: EAL domain-containing protein [Synechococcales cyanobacterium M58_A2018_015]|nr:EAL domain-containing protein [Synechococcales cyanobacterium M58_A2018_015]